jgi:hypothetical protein
MEPQSPGFEFRYRIGRGTPTIVRLPFRSADRPSEGDMLSYSGGEVDVAVTGSAALLGTALAPDAVSESEHTVPVIIDADAIYAVADTTHAPKVRCWTSSGPPVFRAWRRASTGISWS